MNQKVVTGGFALRGTGCCELTTLAAPTDTFDYHFFLTLHTFTTPLEVLAQLEVLMGGAGGVAKSVVSIMYKWMRKRPKDFFDDSVCETVRAPRCRLLCHRADFVADRWSA